jgi:SAM-dependent methyltransferase
MKHLSIARQVAIDTKALAIRAMKKFSPSQAAYHIARQRVVCPVDYARYAEFAAIINDFEINSKMVVLDVSSPQWFSLYLASKYPSCKFEYINILESEISEYPNIAKALDIHNISYCKEDVRGMQYANNTFDRIISISVIEHVYPENDGDKKALSEIYRVLKHRGEFLFTVPFKSNRNILYVNDGVYERTEKKRNFFAREYDRDMFYDLVNASDFKLTSSWYICERSGIFPLDYYQWGPGRNIFYSRYLLKFKRLIEKVSRHSLDELLAKQYLRVSRDISGRLVNISAKLQKA